LLAFLFAGLTFNDWSYFRVNRQLKFKSANVQDIIPRTLLAFLAPSGEVLFGSNAASFAAASLSTPLLLYSELCGSMSSLPSDPFLGNPNAGVGWYRRRTDAILVLRLWLWRALDASARRETVESRAGAAAMTKLLLVLTIGEN
jgi:hypothetical protein